MNINVELADEEILYLHKLELSRLAFERKLTEKLELGESFIFGIVDNTRAEYRTPDGTCLLASAEWDLLGIYHDLPENLYNWIWAWTIIEPEEGTVQNTVKNVVLSSHIHNEFKSVPSFVFKEPIIISYLLARLLDTFKYSYIHIIKSDDDKPYYSAFGIRKVEWSTYDPDAHKKQLYYDTVQRI